MFTIFATSSLPTIFALGPLAAAHPRSKSSWRMNVMRSVGKYLFGLLAAAAAEEVEVVLAFGAGFLDFVSVFCFGVCCGSEADLGGCFGGVVVVD
jgi:hypothetical protein